MVVWVVMSVVMCSRLPRRELHERCAGLSCPVILPPFATGLMWSAVKLSLSFQCAPQLMGLPHSQHGMLLRLAWCLSASRLATYARSLRHVVAMCFHLLSFAGLRCPLVRISLLP